MNAQKAAQANLERAELILEEAQRYEQNGMWNLVIRRCQEVVELALKGALLWVGLEVPKIHDIGIFLRQNQDRFPAEFVAEIPRLASASRALRVERERSFYGDEESGFPPEMLYSDEDAAEALQKATLVIDVCRQLIKDPRQAEGEKI